ncbi:hypothetical protein BDQ94DRAFT_155627 [Aspergillus welwitschiae]|uniref:Uncharacterized protein n=1 Tax=Aspergillus welwitschiae TaxID=1341132 RepID=A0A3F3PHF4_9EURO|nr:hypothetical protein BDQ94DRAFT_155627 [Aspergillus welwitschiae]RDH26380.1 hypothetical protein BDQ94DRAFT_155627 [Aspergillus welwitschiae]
MRPVEAVPLYCDVLEGGPRDDDQSEQFPWTAELKTPREGAVVQVPPLSTSASKYEATLRAAAD